MYESQASLYINQFDSLPGSGYPIHILLSTGTTKAYKHDLSDPQLPKAKRPRHHALKVELDDEQSGAV
jgi:hypothetical protein